MMERSQLDLIYIMDEPMYNNNWNKAMEVKEEIVFVSSPAFELANAKCLKLDDLLEQPFFLTERNANYRHALDRFLASRQMILSPFLEISNTEFIIEMLKENRGLSFLPYFAVRKNAEEGSLAILDVDNFRVSMYRQIFYHKDKWKTKEMDEFIRLAKLNLDQREA